MHSPPNIPMELPFHLSKLALSSDDVFSSSFEHSRISSSTLDYSILQSPSSPPTRTNCSTPINDLAAIPASLFDSPSPIQSSATHSRPLFPRAQTDFVVHSPFSSNSPTEASHGCIYPMTFVDNIDYSQKPSKSFVPGSASIYSGLSSGFKPFASAVDSTRPRGGGTFVTVDSEQESKAFRCITQPKSLNDIESTWIQVPSRFLKIANLPKTIEPWLLKETFKGFGSLDDIYIRNLSLEGWVIVSFFDLRDAIKTNKKLRHQRLFNDRRLDSQFCSRNTVISLTQQEIYSKNQGEVSVTVWSETIPTLDSLQMLLSSFGDIRFLSQAGPVSPNVFICEFFDLREASSAVDMLNGRSFNGTLFELAYHEPDSVTWKMVSQLLHMNHPKSNVHHLPTVENAVPISASAVICPTPLSSLKGIGERISVNNTIDLEVPTPIDTPARPGTTGSSMLQNARELKTSHNGSKSVFPSHLYPKLGVKTQDENFTPEKFQLYSPVPLSAPPVCSKGFAECYPDIPAVSKNFKRKSSYLTPSDPNFANIQNTHKSSLASSSVPFASNPITKETTVPLTFSPPMIVTLGNVPDNNKVDLTRIKEGLDLRTTIMVKNVPNKYTQQMLLEYMNEICEKTYDFLYLRIDFKNKCNVGYAFVNFIEPKSIIAFAEARVGTKWNKFHSDKICDISYANIQGKESLIEKFRNSSVMDEQLTYRPKIFKSSGPCIGEEEMYIPCQWCFDFSFPEPNNVHHKLRSVANAQQIGLFPPLAARDIGRNKRTLLSLST